MPKIKAGRNGEAAGQIEEKRADERCKAGCKGKWCSNARKKCREKQISRRVIRPEQQKEVSG